MTERGETIKCGCGAREGEYHKSFCDIVENKGYNFIFFSRPDICARCGIINPGMFMVSDEDWEYISRDNYNKEDILCRECMMFIYSEKKKRKILG